MSDQDYAIRVDDLSKRYLVGHQSAGRERYVSLRDTLARRASTFARNLADLARGRQIIQGDEIEEFWALKDVSFDVKRGDVLGIVGRNGAGKSTLLKILSRITEPTEGRVRIKGRVASLLEVGTGFHPELTGRENIFLNGAILGMTTSEIRAKFDEIVAFAEVEKFLDTPVKRYSSGMYVRLAFAVAAHLEPEILIIDEVLAVGDAEFQKKCLRRMSDVARGGRTVLFVSHNMAAVERLCNRAILLAQGRCVAEGATAAVVNEYLSGLSRQDDVPLLERKDRKGTGDIRTSSLSLENSDGGKVAAFRCGSDAVLHFVLENSTGREIDNLQVSVGIDNDLDRRVALLDTALANGNISKVRPGNTSVRIKIPKLPLTPGRYRVTIYTAVNDVIADWIRHAAFFDVEGGDFYGAGRLPPPDQAIVLVEHSFSVT
jgi:lipopolysaccharide transport system ATP-binding protein